MEPPQILAIGLPLLSAAIITLLVYLLNVQKRKSKAVQVQADGLRNKYKDIIDLDSEIEKKSNAFETEKVRIEKEISASKLSLDELREKYTSARNVYDELSLENKLLKETLDIAEFGVYEPHFELDTSEAYKEALIQNKERQKASIQNESAAKCYTNWSVGSSQAKGQVMTRRAIKLTLRAFNGECDSFVAKVKWNNIEQSIKRIRTIFNAINKLNASNDIHIQEDYLKLKIEEIRLTHEYHVKKYEEKEEQKRIRAQMREEEKAQRDFEKARKEAEKEEKLIHDAMLKAKKEIEQSTEAEREKFEKQMAELKTQLQIAEEKNQRAISMAQQTKSGHVYIISNLGSFGENIYKIGMTRRLEPLDRVHELGDASVPFKFDVHAMIYSDNAPELENELHKTFHKKRLNFVNLRREYFDISLDEIEEVVRRNHGEIEFTKVSEAKEYRESLIIKEQMENKSENDNHSEPSFPNPSDLF